MIAGGIEEVLAPGEAVIIPSPEVMREVASRIAQVAQEGDVVALHGELGAGKTEFVKGFVEQMGVDAGAVTSPTFTLIHEYDGGRLPIYHFDAYRVKSPVELVDMGLDEYLYGSGICLIEWPDIVEHLLPEHTLRLRLEHDADGSRRITRLT